jgi:hypothetical protein
MPLTRISNTDSVWWACQGQTPFYSVLRRFDVCVVCCVQGLPSQSERMDVCCSRGGHRHVHRQISWDGVMIVGGEEVAILPAGEVGTRGA